MTDLSREVKPPRDRPLTRGARAWVMEPLLTPGQEEATPADAPARATTKQAPLCCRGAFFLGVALGIVVALLGVGVALWQVGVFSTGAPAPATGPRGAA